MDIFLFSKYQSHIIRLSLLLYFELSIKIFHASKLINCVIWCLEIFCQPEIYMRKVFIHKEIKFIYTCIYVWISLLFVFYLLFIKIFFLQSVILTILNLWVSFDSWYLDLTLYIIKVLDWVLVIIFVIVWNALSLRLFVNTKLYVVSSHYRSIWNLKYFWISVMNSRYLTNLLLVSFLWFSLILCFI